MNTRNMVDPELLPLLETFQEPEYSDENIISIRSELDELVKNMSSENIDTVSIEEKFIDTENSQVRILIYTPLIHNDKKPALLHTHAGGFIVGNPEMYDARNQRLSSELGAVIISVDYALAPEHPFPKPIEDCYSALKWLHDNAIILGVDASKIGIYGESAGGGLAASLAILARDRKQVGICYQFLIYPMLDDRTSVETEPNKYTGEFVWGRKNNKYGWSSLLGYEPGKDNVSPYVSAARVESMAGLPPAFISVGTLDLFVDENIKYAHRLIREGIPTEFHIYPGAYHWFDAVRTASISKQFEVDLIRSMKKAFGITIS